MKDTRVRHLCRQNPEGLLGRVPGRHYARCSCWCSEAPAVPRLCNPGAGLRIGEAL